MTSLQLEDIQADPTIEAGNTSEPAQRSDPVKDIHIDFLTLAQHVGATLSTSLEECLCNALGHGIKHNFKNLVGVPVGAPISTWFDV